MVMNTLTYTNVSVYKAIAEEAYSEMIEHYDKGRRPKEDGAKGVVITYDPSQISFKKSMVAIVFTAMWLEAVLHLALVRKFGVDSIKSINRNYKLYEDKLVYLGATDHDVISNVKKFRLTRNELIHEKSHLDKGDIKNAQNEAHLANKVMESVGLALQHIS
jgi:hypothetical protein